MTDQLSTRRPARVLDDHAEHGLVLRLTTAESIRAARENLERAAADTGPGGFWVEASAGDSASPDTVRLRRREVLRPLAPADPGPRIVLTCHRDGVADLTVVARRGLLDHAGLRDVARALTRPGCQVRATADRAGEASVRGTIGWTPAPVRPWGLAADGPVPPPGTGADARCGVVFPAGQRGGAAWVPADGPPWPGVAPDFVLAAVAVVLARYEGRDTVRVAVLAPGPQGAVTGARMVRVDVGDTRPAADVLAQVRAELDGTGDTADDPGPEECPSVCLALIEPQPDEWYVPLPPDAVPLTLVWHGQRGRFAPALLTHDTGVHPAVAADVQRAVARLAAELADDTGIRTVGDLALLDGAEAAELVARGRVPRRAERPTTTVHDAVSAVARARPDAVAVRHQGRDLTYRELDERATAWARVLVAEGAGPGRFVGVCLKRTGDLVVALLAVLRSGAAYVPMDPQSPDERLRHIASDAGLVLVITTLTDFPAAPGTVVVRPAALTGRIDGAVDTPLPAAGPDDPAYVIYTSGTTGRPKGVLVPHRNVLALMAATAPGLSLRPDDTWTFFHSVAFDFSVWEIWGCLLTGARLVVVPYLVARSPEEFHALLVQERVSVLSQTPSAFLGLLDVDARVGGPVPRLIVLGGEAFDPRTLGGWFRRHPGGDGRLVNMYGITETTVHVTSHEVRPWDAGTRPHCVGRAIPGWSVSVRDSRGRPLPPGAVGEIYVGGDGLAVEYLNQPTLTAERFVVDPVSGERLYRSGDLGRLRLDGALDHAGRLDEQVKIRGFRIELGEVRSVLLADVGVTEAVVAVEGEEDGPAHRRMVAYLVLAPGAGLTEVRRRIATVLPDYMIPAELVDLPVLPLTLNGKLDRAALPARRPAATGTGGGAVAPGGDDPVDAMLAVWRDVIAAEVGPQDHFFEVGGNSLLAVRMVTALRGAGFGSVSLGDLYRHPTPAGLAGWLVGSATGRGGAAR